MNPGTYTIRPLADYAEMKRAVDFQRIIWGSEFDEAVPAAVFWFARRIGGIVAGAFDASGDMAGLIFGVTGWDGARPIHWSDMLGVHPSTRGRGLGFDLKAYQRNTLLEQGVTTVKWTFDPLEARNAWLNFARLGVTSREYVRDAYGASSSPLHRGIGTDRLVVEWQLDSRRVRERMEGDASGEQQSRAPHSPESETGSAGGTATINADGGEPILDLDADRLRLLIPDDIQALKGRDAVAARRWRERTRRSFEAYFAKGYEASDVDRRDGGASYVLTKRRA